MLFTLGVSVKNGRNKAGKFTLGNAGRPRGARNKKTLTIESFLEGMNQAFCIYHAPLPLSFLNFIFSGLLEKNSSTAFFVPGHKFEP